MINEKWVQQYCCEDISKIYGYKEAVNDKSQTYVIHHCLGLVWSKEQLIEMGLYYNQPADRLMLLTYKTHANLHSTFIRVDDGRKTTKLHNKEFLSEETRKKKSEAMKGKKQSQEHIRKRIEPLKGRRLSENTKKQISESRKGKGTQPKSEETKQKMSKAREEYWKTHTKHIFQYTLDGEFVKEWSSLSEINKTLGYDMKSISNCCKGKQKTAYKHLWKYKPLS